MFGRAGAALVAVLLAACGGNHATGDGPSQSGPAGMGGAGNTGAGGGAGAPGDLPELTMETLGEISLAGFTGSAEDLVVDQGGITVLTLQGSAHFTLDGVADPEGITPQRAGAGADAFQPNWFATVGGSVLAYYGWELMISPLEGTVSATGIAADIRDGGAVQHLYVTDAYDESIEEHTTAGGLVREIVVPGADLQAVAFSPGGRLFALDALRRRLVRPTDDLSALDVVARLPPLWGEPSGMHWFESLLYVCFRDSNRVAVLRLNEKQ